MNASVNNFKAPVPSQYTRSYAWNIVPRHNLDFKLNDPSIPKYWFGGDAFKTRFLEAVMATFPEGEKFFISSVRLYKEQITDPQLQQDVKDFTQQEAQHGMVHMQFNDKIAQQGMPVSPLLAEQKKAMQFMLKHAPAKFCISHTSAIEHITALLAEVFFDNKGTLKEVHPNIRAMLAWHAIEEMEHKAVAFDVMQQIAKVNHPSRAAVMVLSLALFGFFSLRDTNTYLAADGYTTKQRAKMMLGGLNWLYGRKGVVRPALTNLLAYFKPDFHPVAIPHVHNYQAWLDEYALSNDPVAAGEALYQAAHD